MFGSRLICCVTLVVLSVSAFAATKAPRRESRKTETLACRLGTEDRHARIAVVLVGGKTDSFAYYSKWKPRTCSIYLQRSRDMYSKWADNGNLTTVSLERGAFLIEHKKNEYHFIFRDIDRERYCGMDGTINGGLTIKKGSSECVLDGDIMVEGTALGQAFQAREEDKPPADLMPDLKEAATPAAGATAKAEQAPPKPAAAPSPTAAPAAKPSVATSQPSAPAAKPSAPPAQTAAPAGQPAAAPAQAAAPATQPSAASTQATAAQTQATAAPSQPPAQDAPAQQAPAKAAEAQSTTPAAAPEKSAAREKPAESTGGNPFRSFFRSLSNSRSDPLKTE